MTTRLIELVEKLPKVKVVLVGDFMLDRYIFGSTGRISPEAPVPVVHFTHDEYRLGGAGFVAAQLAALGASVAPIGVVGTDAAGIEVRERLAAHGDTNGLVQVSDRPTVNKVRVLGSSQDRTPQQMLRLDIEDPAPIAGQTAAQVLGKIESAIATADLVVLEDYNKGVLTPEVCRRTIELARHRHIPVIIDPASINDYGKYAGATALKLNRPEAEKATGLPVRCSDHYAAAAEKLLRTLNVDAIVITLNELGAYLGTADGQRKLLSTRPREVADATGAGDVVLSMLSMARVAGASWEEAVALANIAGGIEVERLGCVPVTPIEVISDLIAEHREMAGKLRTMGQLLPELSRHRVAGRKIVFTNGCFDLIHLGHVKYFQFAKAQGDILVVGVNTDSSIQRLKGDKRPIINEHDRCSVLEELESIDYLITFDSDTPIELIRSIRPDVLVKGADYRKEQVVGWDFVESCGGNVALAPLIDGRSTTSVIQRILDAYGPEGSR